MTETGPGGDGVLARAVEVVEIAEAARVIQEQPSTFTAGELAYAHARADPVRRLAARLAAKRAALRLLGAGLAGRDVEIARGEHGPPTLRLSAAAAARMGALGATRALVSLTHERSAAAALVLLLSES